MLATLGFFSFATVSVVFFGVWLQTAKETALSPARLSFAF
jgi:hypothetical protein